MIIRAQSHARAGLVGNPSDGYYGKTISFLIRNARAEVVLYESPELAILPRQQDHSVFRSVGDLVDDVRVNGYYGGVRLLKASVKRFADYCAEQGIRLPARNFSITYGSTIPRHVGMAGSSAIITAALRAMMQFYGVAIPTPILANLTLSVETKELDIAAGLQDRVVQAYGGVVYMDFDRHRMKRQGYGQYEQIDPALLPPLYVAYRADIAEPSERVHNNVRERYEEGDPRVVKAMATFAGYAERVRDLLLAGKGEAIGPILDRNFNLRKSICRIGKRNLQMIETARAAGASAKFAGSSGAIVGTYKNAAMFRKLSTALKRIGCRVLKPKIV
jgi:glucuronokinase